MELLVVRGGAGSTLRRTIRRRHLLVTLLLAGSLWAVAVWVGWNSGDPHTTDLQSPGQLR